MKASKNFEKADPNFLLRKFCNKVVSRANIRVLFYFGLEGITKHLMTSPSGNSEFCFPSTHNVPVGFALRNIEDLGETNLTVSLWASH